MGDGGSQRQGGTPPPDNPDNPDTKQGRGRHHPLSSPVWPTQRVSDRERKEKEKEKSTGEKKKWRVIEIVTERWEYTVEAETAKEAERMVEEEGDLFHPEWRGRMTLREEMVADSFTEPEKEEV